MLSDKGGVYIVKRTIKQVEFKLPAKPQVTRVAAYARVSCGKDAMLHSLSAQVSYYSHLIQNHSGWLYCGVYADEAITGTKDARENFQRLLTECKDGKIDMVITKSISRFARNTVTLLQTVRELKGFGVDVYFEEQNIHTMSADGELMMTILASYAQEESLSASENQKWRIKKNFEAGIPWSGTMLGYRKTNDQYTVVPEEAETVKRVFEEYLMGYGFETICDHLNADGITTRNGNAWSHTSLSKILKNYAYTGNLLLQKTYRENHITKKTRVNHGELPMYHATDTHEPIISMAVYDKVQQERTARAERYVRCTERKTFPFSSKMVCMECGKNYRRKVTVKQPVWICGTYNAKGKAACPTSKQIPEDTLMKVTASVIGVPFFDDEAFKRLIKRIEVGAGNTLRYIFTDGHSIETVWTDRSRAESWTPEMKEAARQKALERKLK